MRENTLPREQESRPQREIKFLGEAESPAGWLLPLYLSMLSVVSKAR